MTALQLAGGIILGFGGLEIIKALVATAFEAHRRNAMKKDLVEVADDFIDKMHKDLMEERAKEAAKKPAPKRKPAAKKPVTKSLSQQRREAVTKAAQKGGKK